MNTQKTALARAVCAYNGPATVVEPFDPENPPETPQDIAKALNKMWHDYKAANDERLANVEQGLAHTKDEELAKMDERLDQLCQLAEDTAAKMQTAGLGGTGADPEATEKLRLNARIMLAGRNNTTLEAVPDADVDQYVAYQRRFSQYLRKGDQGQGNEFHNEMQIGTDADGGYWVPTERSTQVITRLFETSPMRQEADVMSITGDSIEWPTDTNDATTGGFVGETDDRSETGTPEVGTQTIYVREQYAMPIVTQRLLDMSTIDVDTWLMNKIAGKFARVENARFVTGEGVKNPRGFLDYKNDAVATDDDSRAWGKLQYVPTGASGGFPKVSGSTASDPDALIDIVSKVKDEFLGNAKWFMKRSTLAAIRKLKDADGNYFVGRITGEGGGLTFDILGYPVVRMQDMPDIAANSFSVAFGDMREAYQIVDGRGMRILRDPFTTKGKVKLYSTKFTGGDVVNFDALKLLKFGTS